MSDVHGETYPEWESFVAEVTAELADEAELAAARQPPDPAGLAAPEPDAGPRRRGRATDRAAAVVRALSLVLAVALPASLGPADHPGGAPTRSATAAADGAPHEPLGLELLGVVPTARDGWVERVAARFEQRLVGLDELEQRHLARALVDEAERAGIDPLLVLAVIQVESSYRLAARSEKGALGLMQLLEPTLREEATLAGEDAANPLDPRTNVRMGIRYLRRLLDLFGKQDLALMAYNAGPNRILGYLRGDGIPERFREYPRRVRAELRRLRRSYPEARPSPALSYPATSQAG
jgi:soluble lytic murein transglycosylase-like protein